MLEKTMKGKRIIIYMSCIFTFYICNLAYAISDLHIVADYSSSAPVRVLINEYAHRKMLAVTADFTDVTKDYISETANIIIYANTDKDINDSKKSIIFGREKLYLCVGEGPVTNGLLSKISHLNFDSVLKVAKMHSKFIAPGSGTSINDIIRGVLMKLSVQNYDAVRELDDMAYVAIKGQSFVILPGSVADRYKNLSLRKLFKIPEDVCPRIYHHLSVVERSNNALAEDFVEFVSNQGELLKKLGLD